MSDQLEQVIVVDDNDNQLGSMGKLEAHEHGGTLHRAFSVFLFNSEGELLLQRRAASKYHFGGLWGNSCCGHPRPGEATIEAAQRRLQEELGLVCELREVGVFRYEAYHEESGYTEREIDHVLMGTCDGTPVPDPNEVSEFRWVARPWLSSDLREHAERYVPWLKAALTQI